MIVWDDFVFVRYFCYNWFLLLNDFGFKIFVIIIIDVFREGEVIVEKYDMLIVIEALEVCEEFEEFFYFYVFDNWEERC